MRTLLIQDLSHEHTLDREAARGIRGGVSYEYQYESTSLRQGEPHPSRPFPFSIFDSIPGMPIPPGMDDMPASPWPCDPTVMLPQSPINPMVVR
jgi:hypothetical protein